MAGYTNVPNEIIREPRLTPPEFRVLLYISMYTNAYPTKWQIMDATGLSLNTVQRTLYSLRDLGVIDWKRGRRGQASEYWLRPISMWNLSSRDDVLDKGQQAKAQRTQAQQSRAIRGTMKRGLIPDEE